LGAMSYGAGRVKVKTIVKGWGLGDGVGEACEGIVIKRK